MTPSLMYQRSIIIINDDQWWFIIISTVVVWKNDKSWQWTDNDGDDEMVAIMVIIMVVIITLSLRWWSYSFHYWNGGCCLTQVKLNPNVIVCFKCTAQSFIDIILITVWCNHLCFHKKVSSSLIIVLVNIESTKAGIRKKGRGMTLSFFKCMKA